jgi:hypothetical protein
VPDPPTVKLPRLLNLAGVRKPNGLPALAPRAWALFGRQGIDRGPGRADSERAFPARKASSMAVRLGLAAPRVLSMMRPNLRPSCPQPSATAEAAQSFAMRPSDPPDELNPAPSGPVPSRECITPRGGFMARPGLKPPPRHAVVVRGGDRPVSDDIPVARASFMPPPPPSQPEPISLSDKVTLRAIPTRSSPPPPFVAETPARTLPHVVARAGAQAPVYQRAGESLAPVVESLPPPSDAPVAASSERAPRSRRSRSRWTIVAAAAAGLLLGLVTVATTMSLGEREPPAAAAPAPGAPLQEARALVASGGVPTPAPPASIELPLSPPAERRAAEPPRAPAARPPAVDAKRSIF